MKNNRDTKNDKPKLLTLSPGLANKIAKRLELPEGFVLSEAREIISGEQNNNPPLIDSRISPQRKIRVQIDIIFMTQLPVNKKKPGKNFGKAES